MGTVRAVASMRMAIGGGESIPENCGRGFVAIVFIFLCLSGIVTICTLLLICFYGCEEDEFVGQVTAGRCV